jgi:sulfatase modifying factor 1
MVRSVHPVAVVLLTLAAVALYMPVSQSPGPARFVLEPRTGMKLAEIPAGRFVMGSPLTQPGRVQDESQRSITIPHPFYLGTREVTQTEWTIVMNGNPSQFPNCGRCPVESVNFYDVDRFIANLNARSTSLRFRLPSEAEWEYACRAGSSTPATIEAAPTSSQANVNDRLGDEAGPDVARRRSTVPVGSYPPNAWGLFDMQGNVWEWTNDWYGDYSPTDVVDPQGPESGTRRVIRGGSWYFDGTSARCGLRYSHRPQDSGFSLGFRLAAEPIDRRP